MKKLVNVTEKVEIELTEALIASPAEIGLKLKELAAPMLGAIQIRTLINGQSTEINGYMVIDEEGEGATEEVVAETAEVVVETNATTDEDLKALLAAESEDKLTEVAPVKEEVKTEEVKTEEVKTEEVKTEEAPKVKTLADDAKSGQKITPAPKTGGAPRKRKDKTELTKSLNELSGEVAAIVKGLGDLGYQIVNIDSKLRWFTVVHKDLEQTLKSDRVDVSPRKNGDFGLSLYSGGKATGVKNVIKKSEKTSEEVLAWVGSDIVKETFKK